MTVKFRRVSIGVAFLIGAVAGLFWLFMLSMALGLYTDFTPTTRVIAYVMCPVLQMTFLFRGAWGLMILSNASLYAAVAFIVIRMIQRRRAPGTQF